MLFFSASTCSADESGRKVGHYWTFWSSNNGVKTLYTQQRNNKYCQNILLIENLEEFLQIDASQLVGDNPKMLLRLEDCI